MTRKSLSRFLMIAWLVLSSSAMAQHGDRPRGGDGDRGRYLPPREMYRPAPIDIDRRDRWPPGVSGSFRGSRYFFDRGRWYADRGGGVVVVRPPIGLTLGMLPPYYSTLWVGGIPYFYADGTYFLWRERERRYVVVDEPSAAVARGEVSYATDDLYVYQRDGQSDEKQGSDRYECHRWATSQTGFDPVQPDRQGGGRALETRRNEYRRAITACLEARGYTVK